MDRRSFLQKSAIALAVLSTTSESQAAPSSYKGLYICQGATDTTNTIFSILHPRSVDVKCFVVGKDQQEILPNETQLFFHGMQSDAVTHVSFSNLLEDQYQLFVCDSKDNFLDQRQFSLLRPNDAFSFVLASCMDHKRHKGGIWQSISALNPDALFFIGDNVYADGGSTSVGDPAGPDELWQTFVESRKTLEVYRLPRLIPLFATWDDHDFGANDTGKSYPYVKESQKNFNIFFPHNETSDQNLKKGPGVSKKITFAGQDFFFMDDRSFREANGSKEEYAHWGQEQHEWMLQQSQSEFVWLLNGSQFFPANAIKEGLSYHHEEHFQKLIADLSSKSQKFLFASGDVHFSEISKIPKSVLGYETLEITSSAIHSATFPLLPILMKNPYRIKDKTVAKNNFNLIRTQRNGTQLEIEIECILGDGKKSYDYKFTI